MRSSQKDEQNESQTSTNVQNARQILAHYRIQLDKQKKKIRSKVESYEQQISQLEKQIKINSKTNEPKKQDSYLHKQIDFKKAQIQNLKRILLKNTDKQTFHSLNTIDQALIPQQTPQQIIAQKQRIIKKLSEELAIAEQKFQGKYFIQHKAINQYQVQMHQNKKLKLYILQSEKQRQFYEKNQKKRSKITSNTLWYYQKFQNQQKRQAQLYKVLNKLQSQTSKEINKKKTTSYQSQMKYLQNMQTQYTDLNTKIQQKIYSLTTQLENKQRQRPSKTLSNQQKQQQLQRTQQKNKNSHSNVRWYAQDRVIKRQKQFDNSQYDAKSDTDSISNTIKKQNNNWNLRTSRQIDQMYDMRTQAKNKKNQQKLQIKKDKYKQFGLDDIYKRK